MLMVAKGNRQGNRFTQKSAVEIRQKSSGRTGKVTEVTKVIGGYQGRTFQNGLNPAGVDVYRCRINEKAGQLKPTCLH